MTLSRVKPGNFAVNEKFTSTQANAIDTNISNALDKTVAGDTLAGVITLASAGRFLPSVTSAANADTTVTVGAGNTIYRVTSTVAAARTYTLSATGVSTNDVITFFAEQSFTQTLTIKDQAAVTIYTLGLGATADGQYASFIYIGGWRLLQHWQGSRIRSQVFNSSGSWVAPTNCTAIQLYMQGGGGGGGGGQAGGGASTASRGGGGGAGAPFVKYTATVVPGATYTVTIGAGGAGGAAAAAGSPGALSSISGTGLYRQAMGGLGGSVDSTSTETTTVALGGGFIKTVSAALYANVFVPAQGGGCGGAYLSDALDGGASPNDPGAQGGPNGTTAGSYNGGGGGGGGGAGNSGTSISQGDGGNGGNGNGGGVGTAGTGGGAGTANTGQGGGGGAGGGAGSAGGGAGGAGAAGGSGIVIISW